MDSELAYLLAMVNQGIYQPSQIVPSSTNNQVLTTVSGATAWATPITGTKATSFISTTGGGNATPSNITSVSLVAGTWLITAQAIVKYGAASVTADLWLGPNSASGTGAYTSGSTSVISTDTSREVTLMTVQTFASTTTVYFSTQGGAGYTIAASSSTYGYASGTTTGITAVRLA